ncbi:MAG TPA: endonuclease/exonuclease/phosphatase family protein [Microlunatus sp.]|nr:endonuclease/exonuclease/phosphatase family protein [Microlunatus sp.]
MITFMFWNLHEAAWSLRAGDDKQWRKQVEVVRRHRPDVLAVTEGWDWHLDDRRLFRRALADFGYPAGELYQAKTTCDMAVMWRDGIELVERRDQPHEQALWHGWMRVALQLPGQPEPFVLMVAHLNPFDPTLRRIEGSFLRVWMEQTRSGLLVMDANSAAPGDPEPEPHPSRNLPGEEIGDRTPGELLAQSGLIDVAASRSDRRPTYGFFAATGPAPAPIRIDQAWATPGVDVVDYRVLDSDLVDPEIDTASDHRPIRVTIRPDGGRQ